MLNNSLRKEMIQPSSLYTINVEYIFWGSLELTVDDPHKCNIDA